MHTVTRSVPVLATRMLLFLAGLTCLGVVMWLDELRSVDLNVLAILSSAAALGLFTVLQGVALHGFYSPSVIYVGLFAAFHLGLVIVLAFGVEIPVDQRAYLRTWFFDSLRTREAVLLVFIGFAALVGGVAVSYVSRVRRRSAPALRSSARSNGMSRLVQAAEHPRAIKKLDAAGVLILNASVAGWFLVGLNRGGSSFWSGSYAEWLRSTEGFSTWWIYMGIGLGLCLIAGSATSFRFRSGYVPFLIFVPVALALGLRGEVMFPVMAALALLGGRLRRPRLASVLLALALTLSLMSTLRLVRVDGISAATSEMIVGPIGGLVELGTSLRPTWEVVGWFDAGEAPMRGATYWAPIERAAALVIPGVPRVPAQEDPRIMNVAIVDRTGSYLGFSPVAEAYVNFKTAGVIGCLFVLGWVLGRMDHWTASVGGRLITGILLVPMLINIRNSFVSVPAQVFVGGAVVLAVVIWAQESSNFRATRRSAVRF